jgi:glutamate-1-semialdehyde 2,1-aminomutase
MKQYDSHELFARAQRVIPGGVNSPVRSFAAVGGDPIYVASGQGSRIRTVEGRELIDFCCSWGPLILGHAHPEVVAAACAAVERGSSFGINTALEVEFAELLCAQLPGIDQIRMLSSGTEAVMTALRLARGFTGRRRIVKFAGCYHGHSDHLLAGAGSGLLTGAIANSDGVSIPEGELLLPAYNDCAALSELVEACGDEIAAVIVEPIAGNMGLVMPDPGFLEHLRRETERCGALLIFDEVITGFRFGSGSYGGLAGVEPDLCCLGKIVGGGFPLAALGGRREIMAKLAPLGRVYQAGTLSGNPVALAAGMKTVEILIRDNPYPRLDELGARLAEDVNSFAAQRGLDFHLARHGGVFTPFFRRGPVRNLADAQASDTAAFARLFRGLLERGFYIPPSQFELGFISAAHSDAELRDFAAALKELLA